MTGRDALGRAVLEDPRDDALRLVFADWLEEHGEAARAEFIRAQVELARLEEADSGQAALASFLAYEGFRSCDWSRSEPILDRMQRLEVRAKELLETHRAEWTEGMGEWPEVEVHFRRGFPGRVAAKAVRNLLPFAEAICQALPVTELDVTFNFGDEVEGLRGVLPPGRLTSLKCYCFARDAAEVLRFLGRQKGLEGVSTLRVEGNAADFQAVASALAGGRGWGPLHRLTLRLRRASTQLHTLDGGMMAALAGAPHLARLHHLDLYGMTLDVSGAAALARGFPELRTLNLGQSQATDGVAEALAGAHWPNLRTLNLSGHRFTATPAVASLLNRGLSALHLAGDNAYSQGVADLAGLGDRLSSSPAGEARLRALFLSGTRLGPEAAAGLAACPALRSLLFLHLSDNPLGAEGALALAQAPWDQVLRLHLWQCEIDEPGASALAGSPILTSVQWLEMGDNPLGPGGCKALAHSPHLRQAQYVALRHTGGNRGAHISLRRRFGEAVSY